MQKVEIRAINNEYSFKNRIKPEKVKENTVYFRNMGNGCYRVFVSFLREYAGRFNTPNGQAVLEVFCNGIERKEKTAIKEYLSIDQKVFWKDCTESARHRDLGW